MYIAQTLDITWAMTLTSLRGQGFERLQQAFELGMHSGRIQLVVLSWIATF